MHMWRTSALQKEGKEKLEQLGTMVIHLRVKVSSDRFGELVYDATSGNKLVRTKAPENSSAPTELTILITYDEAKHELSFAYDFSMPPPFYNQAPGGGGIDCRYGAARRRTASMSFASPVSPAATTSAIRSIRILPPSRALRMGTLLEHYQEDEKKPGIVHLPGWLLPGNGICLGTERTGSRVQLSGSCFGVAARKLLFQG